MGWARHKSPYALYLNPDDIRYVCLLFRVCIMTSAIRDQRTVSHDMHVFRDP